MGKKRYAKRKSRQVYRHMDTLMEYLLSLSQMYEEFYPERAKQLVAIAKGVNLLQDTFSRWYGEVWGSPPSDWYSDA